MNKEEIFQKWLDELAKKENQASDLGLEYYNGKFYTKKQLNSLCKVITNN